MTLSFEYLKMLEFKKEKDCKTLKMCKNDSKPNLPK